MNDPHVKALLYRVEHSPTFDYRKARPRECDLSEFHIWIENDQATAKPKQHFATAKEAQDVVEPFLRAWELDAALNHDNPDALRFVYLRAEIVERNPQPGSVRLYAQPGHYPLTGWAPTASVGREEYPAPPSEGLAVEPGSDVEAMLCQWSRYKTGRAPLGQTADFCRGALEKGGGRQTAADRYRIDRLVIDKLGDLSDEKGGPHARKYKGYGTPYTEIERAWLEAVLKKLIRRAAEVAYDPNADRACITMDDLDLPRL